MLENMDPLGGGSFLFLRDRAWEAEVSFYFSRKGPLGKHGFPGRRKFLLISQEGGMMENMASPGGGSSFLFPRDRECWKT